MGNPRIAISWSCRESQCGPFFFFIVLVSSNQQLVFQTPLHMTQTIIIRW